MTWKVLLLDDDAPSAAELQHGLHAVGCDVQLVDDTRTLAHLTSVSRFISAGVDVILVSVALPQFGGLDLFERVHADARRRGIPVVLVASDAAVLARHRSSRTPAEAYVARPSGTDALAAELGARLTALLGTGNRTLPPGAPEHDLAEDDGLSEGEVTVVGTRPGATDDLESTATRPRVLLDAAGPKTRSEAGGHAPASPRGEDVGRIERVERQLAAEREAHRQALLAAADEAEERLAEERAMGESALTSMAAELHAQSIRLGARVDQATARARAAEERVDVERGRSTSTLNAATAALDAKQRELDEAREAAGRRDTEQKEELRRARATLDDLAAQSAVLHRDLEAERADHAEKVRAAEDRHGEERTRAAKALAAAEAAFDRKQRELLEAREAAAAASATATKQAAGVEQHLAVARSTRDQLQRDLDAERTKAAETRRATEDKLRTADERLAATEQKLRTADEKLGTAEQKLRAAEERHGEERTRLTKTLTAAESAFDRKQRELVDTRESAALGAKQAAALEEDLRATRDAEAAATRRIDEVEEELRAARTTHQDLVREREQLERGLDAERAAHEATAALGDERLRAAEARHAEEQARNASALSVAKVALDARQSELLEIRVAATMRAEALAEELRLLRLTNEDLTSQLDQLQRKVEAERTENQAAAAAAATESATRLSEAEARGAATLAAREGALEARLQGLRESREREAGDAKAQGEQLRAALAARDDLTRENARLTSELDSQRATARQSADNFAAQVRALEGLVAERDHAEVARAAAATALAAKELEVTEAREQAAAVDEDRRAAEAERDALTVEEGRLQRELAALRLDCERGESALRSAEERVASLEAHAMALVASENQARSRLAVAGEAFEARTAALASERDAAVSRAEDVIAMLADAQRRLKAAAEAPIARDPGRPVSIRPAPTETTTVGVPQQRSARSVAPAPLPSRAPPPVSARRPGVRRARPANRRAVLLIDRDKVARVNVARALARAGCEVAAADDCVGIADRIDDVDVIVTEIVDVHVEELLEALRVRSDACAVVVWTLGVEHAWTLFARAGIEGVSVLQKASRPDELVAVVTACFDAAPRPPGA